MIITQPNTNTLINVSADSATVEIEVERFGAFSFSVLFVDVFDGTDGNWDDATESGGILPLERDAWLDRWFFISLLSEYVGVDAQIIKMDNK